MKCFYQNRNFSVHLFAISFFLIWLCTHSYIFLLKYEVASICRELIRRKWAHQKHGGIAHRDNDIVFYAPTISNALKFSLKPEELASFNFYRGVDGNGNWPNE